MDFSFSPELVELRERARAVAAQAVAAHGATDHSWIIGQSPEFSRTLAAEGWLGMTWPVEHGGRARPMIERVVVFDELISAGAPVARSWVGDRQMGPSIIAFGTPDQQDRFLPGILSGEDMWCIGMSEPNAGSDLAGLTTSAARDGNDWVINGQKIWTSGATVADYCYLICRTFSGRSPHEGISEIIVPMDSPGIEARTVTDLTGNRHFCEVFFDNARVPIENLVGVEGSAFRQTMTQLEHERGGIDRLASNVLLYNKAKALADRNDPVIRQRIAAIETGYRIGRILVYREALRQAPKGFSAATKVFCTEHEQRVAEFAASVLGARATLATDDAMAIAYSAGYTIMGGTSNVLRNILGERVLGLPREPR